MTKIYHYSNEGEISWYEFAKEIFKIAKVDCEVNPISTQQYPTPAKRPKNTLMNKDEIVKVFNIKIRSWKKSLEKCIYNRKLRSDPFIEVFSKINRLFKVSTYVKERQGDSI